MSVHTMPPMSLICEDFLKSMVKSSETKSMDNNHQNSNSDEDVLTTRLNGDQNGFGAHSDDDDEDDDDNDTKMTNGSSASPKPTKKIRKDLMEKTEELKRKQKSLGISENNPTLTPAAHEDEENKLRCMAKQVITLDF